MKYYISLSILLLISNLLSSQTDFSRCLKEGNYSYEKEEYVNAIKKYSKALEYKSQATNAYQVADVYIYRAACRFNLFNSEGALEDLNAALKIKPEYSKIYHLISQIYFSNRDPDKCIEWCDKGLGVKPNDDELLIRKAKCLTGLKKYDESNTIYFELITENPKNLQAFQMVASNFNLKKNWDSAQKYFSMAILLDPKDFASYYDRGICHAEQKKFGDALADMEKGMALDSVNSFVGYNNIGFFIKLEEKDYQGAIKYYDKALELKPDFGYAFSNRGYAKLKLGDIKGAYKDIRKSIELDKTNSYAYKNLALVYISDGKKGEACSSLRKALDLGYKETYDDEVDGLLKDTCEH